MLVASYLLFENEDVGVWTQLWDMSIGELVLGDNSLIERSRLIDYIFASLMIVIITSINQKLAGCVFDLFPKKTMNEYMQSLKNRHNILVDENKAIRLYFSSQAKMQKDSLLKKLMFMRSLGIIFLTMSITAIIGINGGIVEILVLVASIIAFLAIQTKAILFYIRDIAPWIVAERVYSGLEVNFGDEIDS